MSPDARIQVNCNEGQKTADYQGDQNLVDVADDIDPYIVPLAFDYMHLAFYDVLEVSAVALRLSACSGQVSGVGETAGVRAWQDVVHPVAARAIGDFEVSAHGGDAVIGALV